MNPEHQLRQRIREQEVELARQAEELQGMVQSSLKVFELKSIIIQSLSAVVQFKPLQELVFNSTLGFAAFKMGKVLFQKLRKVRWPKATSE
jgi:hypothetical protein